MCGRIDLPRSPPPKECALSTLEAQGAPQVSADRLQLPLEEIRLESSFLPGPRRPISPDKSPRHGADDAQPRRVRRHTGRVDR
jgi:hypothetical protein